MARCIYCQTEFQPDANLKRCPYCGKFLPLQSREDRQSAIEAKTIAERINDQTNQRVLDVAQNIEKLVDDQSSTKDLIQKTSGEQAALSRELIKNTQMAGVQLNAIWEKADSIEQKIDDAVQQVAQQVNRNPSPQPNPTGKIIGTAASVIAIVCLIVTIQQMMPRPVPSLPSASVSPSVVTSAPTVEPTAVPTLEPTAEPTAVPTPESTPEPTSVQTPELTAEPTIIPSSVPDSSAEAVRRYFEAQVSQLLPAEAEKLLAQDTGIFSIFQLNLLPVPDNTESIQLSAYLDNTDEVLYEVQYSSHGRTVHTWVSTVHSSEGWKLAGASNTFGPNQSTVNVDFDYPLIPLNEVIHGEPGEKGTSTIYRVLVPASGVLEIYWQSGSKATDRKYYDFSLTQDSLNGPSVLPLALLPHSDLTNLGGLYVAPGVYYLTMTTSSGGSEPYQLKLAYRPSDYVELQNNDTYVNATPMELNTNYSGLLSSKDDTDWYSFTLEEPGGVNVTFTPDIQDKGSSVAWNMAVLSGKDLTPLSSVGIGKNSVQEASGNLYLSAGTYLVRVTKGSVFSSYSYKLKAKTIDAGLMESEPNNTQLNTNFLPNNQELHGSFGISGDVDWYAFNVTLLDAVVQPVFAFLPTEVSTKTYVLSITDIAGNTLFSFDFGGKESSKVIPPVPLKSGIYKIKLENPRFVPQDYTLKLLSVPVDNAEGQPNNTAALATQLTPNQPVTGALSAQNDVDYYRIVFADETTATLNFAFTQSNTASSVFTVSIEQNGKTLKKFDIKGDSGGLSQPYQYPAGEYFFQIKPASSAWLSSVYTITLDTSENQSDQS